MKTYESSAKTIEEAISAGLETLGVSISDVTVDIIDEGSKGLLVCLAPAWPRCASP